MSDVAQIVIAICSAVTALGVPLIAYFMAKLNKKAGEAAAKVDEVAVKVNETNDVNNKKLDGLAQVAQDTHTLVNSNMAVQLKLNAVMSRRLANMPNATEDDKRAADLSEKLFHEHEVKQATVDKSKAENGREKDKVKDR